MSKQMEEFNKRVDELLSTFEPYLDGLEGAKLLLMKDGLRDYCRICVQLDDVTEQCIKVGTTIENVQGNLVKNPDITTMHQFANEKSSLLPKLLKHLEPTDKGTGDDFDDWLENK